MSVLIEGISVVIRVEAIEHTVAGGVPGVAQAAPNGSFCSDGELVRLGFTDAAGASSYVAELEAAGLVPADGGAACDLVVVDQQAGFCMRCDWAEVVEVVLDEERGRSVMACRARGSQGPLRTPAGWDYETSLTHNRVVLPAHWAPEFLETLGMRHGVTFYRDLRTGRELALTRPAGRAPDGLPAAGLQVVLQATDAGAAAASAPAPAAGSTDWSSVINDGAPWTLLGLPDPHAGALEDPQLAATYREVCASLEVDPAGRFVRADGYPFYHAASAFTHGDPSWLQLICGLYHPNAHQMRFIRERFRDSMGWGDEEEPWLSEEEVGPWHSLLTLRSFLDFMQSRDFATLTANTVPARTRGRLSGTIGGFGCASAAHLHLSRYSRDWTIVVWWAGPEPDAEGVFPTVLGFVRSDDLERNTVHLLQGMDLFTIPDQFIGTTGVSDLVAAGWCGSEDEPSIGPFLAQFCSRELAILRAAWGGLLAKEAYSARALLSECMDEEELRSVRERFGPLRSAAYFEQVYEKMMGEVP